MFLCVCVYDCVCVFVASPVSIYDSTGSVRTARQKQSMLAADRNGMGPQAGLRITEIRMRFITMCVRVMTAVLPTGTGSLLPW